MAIIANRVKVKSNLQEVLRLVMYGLRKSTILILLILTLLFTISNNVYTNQVLLEAIGRIVGFTTLIYEGVISKVLLIGDTVSYYKDLEAENSKLKVELARMQNFTEQAMLARNENESLKQLLNVANQQQNNYIAAKLLTVNNSPFSNNAILGAGSKNGVKINNVVLSSFGLVGRIIEVSDYYSKMMLINDYNSRVPVVTGNSRIRGMLAKVNSHLKLIYLDENDIPQLDEVVYTSGDGKIFPDGIKVGKIVKIDTNGVIIDPSVTLRDLEFVLITSVPVEFAE